MDYQVVDLSPWCTVGLEIFDTYDSGGTWFQHGLSEPSGGRFDPRIGSCDLRGIPFQIGPRDPADAARYIDFMEPNSPKVTIPINAPARRVIFAHAVLATWMWLEGAPLGEVLANYVFRWEDGREESVPIRERLEIGHFPQPWGHQPFLAVPDRHDTLAPRYSGLWANAGARQVEVIGGVTHGYHLWAWANSRPEVRIAEICIEPARPGFIIAGITLGQLDEDPLHLPPRRTILLSGAPSDLSLTEVLVDRGVASYPYRTVPLPDEGDEAHIPAFGRFISDQPTSRHYVHLSAIPSATVTLEREKKGSVSFEWGQLSSGKLERDGITIEIASHERNWVHTTVRDDAGRPVPCRVAFTSDRGVPFVPTGHNTHENTGVKAWGVGEDGDIRLGDVSYSYIDGKTQGWLPRGRVHVEIARGYEYTPVAKWVEIKEDQRSLDLQISRWTDMRKEGWFSGDTHVHCLTPDGALKEGQGEDLSVVNLLQVQLGHVSVGVEGFTGETRSSSDGATLVHVSSENRQSVLGHLCLLGLTTAVWPLSSAGPTAAELGGTLDTTLSHWADAAHAQGATVIVGHMPKPNGEIASLIATGRVDALEMMDFKAFEYLEYYRYLNGAYRLPLVGGTDKIDGTQPIGLIRTYAQLTEDLSLAAWLRAIRAGRTFITSGPMLWFTVDGLGPGNVLTRSLGARVTVKARANSILPIHSLQIIQGGEVVAQVDAPEGSGTLELQEEVSVSGQGWLAARCAGPDYKVGIQHNDKYRKGVMAHTSPVYVETGVRPASYLETIEYMDRLVQATLDFVRNTSLDPDGSVTYSHGLTDHRAYLEGPFLEARTALAKRREERR